MCFPRSGSALWGLPSSLSRQTVFRSFPRRRVSRVKRRRDRAGLERRMDAYRKITGQRQDSDAFRAEPGQRMDKREACCFTGHRKLPANRIAEIMERLEEEIERFFIRIYFLPASYS